MSRIKSFGTDALSLQLELSNEDQIERAVADTLAAFGRLDIVVNNAAVSIRGAALEYDARDWDRVFATNVRGVFLMSRAAARVMRQARFGRIVNLSSPFAHVGLPNRAAYAASKAAVEQLTRSLAVEWASHEITVNAVAPTTVITETRAELLRDDAVVRDRIAQIPLGRLGLAEDVVGATLLLCGPGGSFITGQTVLVDGGYSVMRA